MTLLDIDIEPRLRRLLRNVSFYTDGIDGWVSLIGKNLDPGMLRLLSRKGVVDVGWDGDGFGTVRITDLGWRVLANFPPPSVGDVIQVCFDPPRQPWPGKALGLVIKAPRNSSWANFVDIFVPALKPSVLHTVHVDTTETVAQEASEESEFMVNEYRRWAVPERFEQSPFKLKEAVAEFSFGQARQGGVQEPPDVDSPVDFTRFTFLDDQA